MLGELPHAERGLHSWLLMTAPPDCSRPGCCREVKQEDGFGCRTCCVPAICFWADPTVVLCPFQLLHPNSEQYTEGISHPLLASTHLNTVPRLKKKKVMLCKGSWKYSILSTLEGRTVVRMLTMMSLVLWHSAWCVLGPPLWSANGWMRQSGRCGWTKQNRSPQWNKNHTVCLLWWNTKCHLPWRKCQ